MSTKAQTRWRRIYTRLWDDALFLALTPYEKVVFFYVLTGTHTNRIGLFRLWIPLGAAITQGVAEDFRKALGRLSETFGWEFDDASSTIWIPSWLTWNQPENPNVVLGMVGELRDLPRSRLWDLVPLARDTLNPSLIPAWDKAIQPVVDAFRSDSESLSERVTESLPGTLREGLPEPFSNGCRKPKPKPEPKPLPNPEPEPVCSAGFPGQSETIRSACPEPSRAKASGHPAAGFEATATELQWTFPTSRSGESWTLPAGLYQEFADSYPGVNLESELAKARAWCVANPGRRKTPGGMSRFLNSWLAKAQNESRGPGRTSGGSAGSRLSDKSQRTLDACNAFLGDEDRDSWDAA